MIKYFSRAFKITNFNIILTTPLVLYVILLSFYSSISQSIPRSPIAGILFIVTSLAMFAAFFAGWLYMVKKAIDLDKLEFVADEDRARASLNLIKEIPIGIGEYFLSFVFGIILYLAAFLLMSLLSFKLGMHFIGKVDVSLFDFKAALASTVALKSFIAHLSPAQLVKINSWYMLIFASMLFYSFITMFWAPEIIKKTKNPIKAFINSVIFISKNFLGVVILFIYINFINFIASLLMNLFVALPVSIPFVSFILSLLSMIVYFYFFVYVVVLIFLYYDSECNRNFKIENIESQDTFEKTADNSGSGADSSGEEQSGNSDSEEN